MLDALFDILQDETAFHKTLVENPAQLFGFGK